MTTVVVSGNTRKETDEISVYSFTQMFPVGEIPLARYRVGERVRTFHGKGTVMRVNFVPGRGLTYDVYHIGSPEEHRKKSRRLNGIYGNLPEDSVHPL